MTCTGRASATGFQKGFGIACAAISMCSIAWGQDAETTSPEKQATATEAIQEIVVTARRKVENIQSVPIAISAVSNADIRRLDIRSVSDLQRAVPALTAAGRLGQNEESLTLRGQRATGEFIGAGAGPAVVSYFAEVPGVTAGPGLYLDLASVQVLKGPQGTLFGRNTTGGAILYEPNRPENQFSGYLQAVAGDLNRRELEGVINVPLIEDVLLARAAAQVQERDGLAIDVNTGREYNNRNNWTARLSLLFSPSGSFTSLFLFQALEFDENGPASVLFAVNPEALVYPLLKPIFDQQQKRGIRRVALGVDVGESRDITTLFNRTAIELGGNLAVTNIVSYSRIKANRAADLDGTVLAIGDSLGVTGHGSGANPNRSILTEELQLTGTALDDRLEWRLGGYLERLRTEGAQTYSQRLNLGVTSHQLHSPQSEDAEAVFGHVTLDLGFLAESLKGVNLSAGYRHTNDSGALGFDLLVYPGQLFEVDAIPAPSPGDLCFTFFATGAVHPHCLVEVEGSDSGQSWNFGLDYPLSDEVLAYGSYRRGYKSGGFNPAVGIFFGTDVPEFSFGPEEVDALELGIKSSWSIGGLQGRTNVALYKNWYNDVQVLNNVLIGVAATTATQNAAEAEIQGMEIEGEFSLAGPLSLTYGYAYTDAQYVTYITPAGEDLSGLPFLYTPRSKLYLGLGVDLNLPSDMGNLLLFGNYAWQDEVFGGFTTPDVPGVTIPSYGLSGVRLEWSDLLGTGLTLAAFINNLGDKEYRIANNAQYESLGYAITQYGEPRIWAISLRIDF